MSDERLKFSYSKCDGMSVTTFTLDKSWYDAHKDEVSNLEELYHLAWKDKENSNADGVTCWYGLG